MFYGYCIAWITPCEGSDVSCLDNSGTGVTFSEYSFHLSMNIFSDWSRIASSPRCQYLPFGWNKMRGTKCTNRRLLRNKQAVPLIR